MAENRSPALPPFVLLSSSLDSNLHVLRPVLLRCILLPAEKHLVLLLCLLLVRSQLLRLLLHLLLCLLPFPKRGILLVVRLGEHRLNSLCELRQRRRGHDD